MVRHVRVVLICGDIELKLKFPNDIEGEGIVVNPPVIHEVKRSRKNPKWLYHHEKSCKYEWTFDNLSPKGREKMYKILDKVHMWVLTNDLPIRNKDLYCPILYIHLKKKKCYLLWCSKDINYWNDFTPWGTKVAFYRTICECPIVKVKIENFSHMSEKLKYPSVL